MSVFTKFTSYDIMYIYIITRWIYALNVKALVSTIVKEHICAAYQLFYIATMFIRDKTKLKNKIVINECAQ